MPGVNRDTIRMISKLRSDTHVQELHLTGLANITDEDFASAVSKLSALRVLNLR